MWLRMIFGLGLLLCGKAFILGVFISFRSLWVGINCVQTSIVSVKSCAKRQSIIKRPIVVNKVKSTIIEKQSVI